MNTETLPIPAPEIHDDGSHDERITAAAGAHVNVVRVELGKETLVIVIVLLIVLSGCGLIMGLNLSKQARQDQDFKDLKTQEWLVERRLMDREALDILHGIKQPGDDEWGATGNLQRMKPTKEK